MTTHTDPGARSSPPVSLVTGGAGFIGAHVAQECLNLGHRVIVVDDLSGGSVENVPDEAQFVEGSVTDVPLMEKLFQDHGVTYVYHLAAYAAEGLSHFIRRFNYTNNVIGTVNLINLSVLHEVECFVFTSSIAVYGEGQLPMTEAMTPRPEDPYGIGKYAAELDLEAARKMFGLNHIVFRPHNVYGTMQNLGDPYRNVIGIFMRQVLQGEPLTVFGDGTQTRAFSHIRDVAPIIARSVTEERAYNQTFNIGADKPYSINQLIEAIAEVFDVEPEVTYLPARNEVQHAYSSHDKVREFFTVGDPTSLEDGIRDMAEWARSRGVISSKPFTAIEVDRNMPPSWREILRN